MRATIENLSPHRREHWCAVTFPASDAATLPRHLTFRIGPGREWRAVRGNTIGSETVVYVRADIDGREVVVGDLVTQALSENPHRMHPWVRDRIGKLGMQAGVRVNGVDHWTQLGEWQLQFANEAVQRWWTRSRGPHGIILEVWGDVWSDDPVVDFYAKVVWSDRADLRWNVMFESVWLRCGEALSIDFAQRHGIVGGVKDATGSYIYLLGSNMPFCDGAALALTGAMLCFKDDEDGLPMEESNRAVRNLAAAAMSAGPVLGVAHQRDGSWLAVGHIARVDPTALLNEANNEWLRFANGAHQNVGWFAPRPVGCTSTPGQTGSQEDFGATKGTFAVALRQPKHIYRLRYAVQADLLRGCQHYEANGRPIDLADHPRWVSWSMVTHYHSGVSPDRLGKEAPQNPANGWRGYDAQHRSQNNLAAYLALCDDPLMADHCKHMLTTDLADYRRRYPNFGPESPRGQGRPAGTWAQLAKVTGDPRFVQLLDAQTQQSYEFMMRLGTGNAMRVLGTLNPDGRVPLFVNGELAPSVSLWEHGLAIVGFWLVEQSQPTNAWRSELLRHVAELLANHALHEPMPGQFALATSCHWNNGDTPLAYLWDSGSGVGGWINAGLLVAREHLGAEHPAHDKLTRYLDAVIPRNERQLGWAEWWAVVDLVDL